MKIKLVITDIDGVWTDGGMYYDAFENELKKFNTSDSAGVIFLKQLRIPLAIVTGEDTKMVARRAEKLKIDYVFQGVGNKLKIAKQLCDKLAINLEEVAFVGDDLVDVPLLRKVGLSAAPANAPEYVKKWVDWRLETRGGQGAFREFVERLLKENNLLDSAIEEFLSAIEKR